MAIDVRAQVYALLGDSSVPVSIVQGSVADESVSPGQAIIRCRGQLIVEGSQTVARGDLIRISYIKENRLYTLPRVLYALSSFIDPFRKTTIIQLGDKLVLNENLRPSPSQAAADPLFPENPTAGDTFDWPLPYPNPDPDGPTDISYTFNGICWKRETLDPVWNLGTSTVGLEELYPGITAATAWKAPLTIPASAIVLKCLAGLGISGGGGISLALHYEQGEISLESGYLSALEQVLSAEGCIAFLDETGAFKITRLAAINLSEPIYGVSLIDKTYLIDIGPGDLGPLPIPPDEEDVVPGDPGQDPDNSEPEPPVAQDFVHGTRYLKDQDAFVNFSEFQQNTQIDQAYQTTKARSDFAVTTAAASSGLATIDIDNSWVKVEPPFGFVGTLQLSYVVNDGFNSSNLARCYIDYYEELAPPPAPPGAPAKPFGGREFEFVEGSPVTTVIEYNNPGDGSLASRTYTHVPRSFTQEIYGAYGEVKFRWEEVVSGGAATASNVFKLHLEAGLSPTSSEARIITTTTFDYTYETSFSPACTLSGECPADINIPENPQAGDVVSTGSCNYIYTNQDIWQPIDSSVNPDDVISVNGKSVSLSDYAEKQTAQPRPTLQITRVYESLYHIAGAINWPELDIAVPPISPETRLVEEVYTEFSVDPSTGISRTFVTRNTARYKLTEGQQYLAELRNTYDSLSTEAAVRNRYENVINYSTQRIFNNAETTLRNDRAYGTQVAPEDNGLFPGGSAGTTGTGSTGTGTAAGTTGTNANPAAPVTLDENGQAQKDYEAWQLANRQTAYRWYVNTFNTLANGSRYGMALELAPFDVSLTPLGFTAVDIDGVMALYRNNGLSFAFDSNGIILSNDALFVGGIGLKNLAPPSSEPYFPVASNYGDLATVPGGSAVPDYIPPYSATLPEGFDPATDLATVTETAAANSTGTSSQVIDVEGVIPIEPIVTTVRAGITVGMSYKKFDYSLIGTTTDQTLGIKVGIVAERVKLVNVPAASITVALASAPAISLGAAVRPPAKNLTVLAGAPAISTGASVAAPLATITVAPAPGPIVPRPAIVFTTPAVDIAVAAGAPAVVSGASVAVPTATITIAGAAPAVTIVAPPVFNATLYTGTGASQSITGVGFEPGLVWTKRRTTIAADHALYDYARGTTKYWRTSSTGAQTTDANSLTAFGSDGFTVGNATISNTNTASYVAWCWPKGTAGASNTDGSITTTVHYNSTAGLSIITYTGTGSNATIGHGLGASPEFVIVKNLGATSQHVVIGDFLSTNQYLLGVGNGGTQTSSTVVQAYSSTTISIGNAASVNTNGTSYVAYAFKSVSGNSDTGTYTGSGASDQSITLGFQPSFLLIKAYSTTGSWLLFDDARGVTKQLLVESANVESTVDKVTFDANGFTVKASQDTNTNTVNYVYLAFR